MCGNIQRLKVVHFYLFLEIHSDMIALIIWIVVLHRRLILISVGVSVGIATTNFVMAIQIIVNKHS